jgi:hypothetical protein
MNVMGIYGSPPQRRYSAVNQRRAAESLSTATATTASSEDRLTTPIAVDVEDTTVGGRTTYGCDKDDEVAKTGLSSCPAGNASDSSDATDRTQRKFTTELFNRFAVASCLDPPGNVRQMHLISVYI